MTKYFIIKCLREADAWISGADLARLLHLSRNAISKQIKNLKNDGYEIESLPKRGYRLIKSPGGLLPTEIDFGDTIFSYEKTYYLAEVDSTNSWVRTLAEPKKEEGLLCLAGKQPQGRGRKDRFWYSTAKGSICFSFYLQPKIPMEYGPRLTLITALALAKTLEFYQFEPIIKWPNDILLNGRKVSGILAEMSSDLDAIKDVIIGVGINHSILTFPEEFASTATSLYGEDAKVSRAELLSHFLKVFDAEYSAFLNGDFQIQLKEIKERMDIFGERVIVKQMYREIEGEVVDLNENGYLQIINSDQEIINVSAGDLVKREKP
ncbi:MAG: biotin--[acetyl-CoA-carboxylase] ligase [Candidatus Cloacimonetes bacterium]|nr:biotin--[acetyl-CoA-carboxylase] ligase [Candidatus Cloacimonadota bacterium]